MLYWLKSQPTPNALSASALVDRIDSTVKRWLITDRQSGLNELLELKPSGSQEWSLHAETLAAREQRLKPLEGSLLLS